MYYKPNIKFYGYKYQLAMGGGNDWMLWVLLFGLLVYFTYMQHLIDTLL